ncbi:hypothetical protein D1BOALGB6SA_7641 [Olavius sp. associated proteobacterium Delta 1]|nr:hypothetical protein D1BOALGB6SA_7641 [Olavius sp. associated proteobacterium Delta 1]
MLRIFYFWFFNFIITDCLDILPLELLCIAQRVIYYTKSLKN